MAQSAKKIQVIGLIMLVIVAAVVVVFAAIAFTNHQSPADSASVCSTTGTDHKVVIKNNQMAPDHVTAPRCDKLTVTNKDSINRLIAFGPHEHHVAYDGVTERLLTPGQSLTVTLDQTGTFDFHDHLHDEVHGTFTVTKQ